MKYGALLSLFCVLLCGLTCYTGAQSSSLVAFSGLQAPTAVDYYAGLGNQATQVRELGKKGHYKPKKSKKSKKSKGKGKYVEPAKVIAVPVPVAPPMQSKGMPVQPMQSGKGGYGNNYGHTMNGYNNQYHSNGYNNQYHSNGYNNNYNGNGYYRRQLKEYSSPTIYTPVQHVPTNSYVPVQPAPVKSAHMNVVSYKPVVRPVQQKYVSQHTTTYVPEVKTTTQYVSVPSVAKAVPSLTTSYAAQPVASYVSAAASPVVYSSHSIGHAAKPTPSYVSAAASPVAYSSHSTGYSAKPATQYVSSSTAPAAYSSHSVGYATQPSTQYVSTPAMYSPQGASYSHETLRYLHGKKKAKKSHKGKGKGKEATVIAVPVAMPPPMNYGKQPMNYGKQPQPTYSSGKGGYSQEGYGSQYGYASGYGDSYNQHY